ncbi:hypothetical protein GCM10029992_11110 [Glycomyces albus]
MKLIAINIQALWFFIAGQQLVNTLHECFEDSKQVLQELAGYQAA